LVFLHTTQLAEEALVTRLTQKILHMLTTRSQAGVLYSVDTRLRPSGAAGLLVSHVDAFTDYQKNQAWTWEHQALLRARIISGNPRIKNSFLKLKKTVLSITRNRQTLQQEVLAMRVKIDQHLELDPIKHARGGLLDVEFLVQFLILKLHDPILARYTHTLSQMKQLFIAHALTEEQYKVLKQAYTYYHHLLHQKIVQSEVLNAEKMQAKVWAVCEVVYEDGVPEVLQKRL
jgi:glutamate-ammonia-ligase adenylyltransferase